MPLLSLPIFWKIDQANLVLQAQRDPEEEGDFMAFEQLMAEATAKKEKDSKHKHKHEKHEKHDKHGKEKETKETATAAEDAEKSAAA